ncbi:MAG: hypothetical protein LC789_05925 [Actinobacteria bacterium]|nr:hypothetical protein [Actinomycetota bacterium]MCA1719939.1 hypothetical protein [Actinomycetota bacterium]
MSAARPLLALGVCAALAAATGVAAAAPKAKPVCNLVSDAKGDGSVAGVAPNDGNLDVLSADVASNGKVITAVLRLASFSAQDAQAPFGRTYYMGFSAPGAENQLYLSVGIDPVLGETYDFGDLQGNLYTSAGTATGSIDAAKGILTVTAPADLGGLTTLKKGVKITDLEAKTTALVGVLGSGLVATADTATGSSYTVGAPSCVVPGKG